VVFVYTAPRVLIAERVAPRYDVSLEVIYNVRRVLTAGTELRLITNSDVYDLVIDDDDELPSADETILEPGFDTSSVKDHDDTTYATPVTALAVGEARDHVVWDLGSVAARIIYAKLYTRLFGEGAYVMVSSDGSTWSYAIRCSGTTCIEAYYGSFRYIMLRSENPNVPTALNTDYQYYSVEVYPPNIRKIFTATADIYKSVRVFSRYSSQLLEFMRLT
jgi:hypothetical protein